LEGSVHNLAALCERVTAVILHALICKEYNAGVIRFVGYKWSQIILLTTADETRQCSLRNTHTI